MKTRLSLFAVLLLASQLVMGQLGFKKLNLSLETNFGVFNGNMLNSPVDMGWCFECWIEAQEQIPKTGKTYGIGTELGFGKRHALGLGIQISEIRFDQKQIDRLIIGNNAEDIKTISVENWYRGWYLQHGLKLLHGKRVELSIRNGLLYERLMNSNYNYTRFFLQKRSISYLGKVEVEFKIGKRGSVLLSPIFRLALRNYNHSDSNEEKYLPFGAGLTIGWRSHIF